MIDYASRDRLIPLLNESHVLIVGCGEVIMVSGDSRGAFAVSSMDCDARILMVVEGGARVLTYQMVRGGPTDSVPHRTNEGLIENYTRIKRAQHMSRQNSILVTEDLLKEAIRMVGVEHWPQEGE